MTDTQFIVENKRGKHYVTWNQSIATSRKANVMLVDMCFQSCNALEIGLHNASSEQILWISAEAWFSFRDVEETAMLVMSRKSFTQIDGVFLDSLMSAEKLREELEKRYVFWLLKEM